MAARPIVITGEPVLHRVAARVESEMANDDGVPARGVVINPMVAVSKIPAGRPDPDTETEGCLSVPGEHYPLRRADRATVHGQDLAGNPFRFEATGWFARVMQHEFDHLNGKLYVDRLDDKHRRKARKMIKANGWGTPGHSWRPGIDPDPFGHDSPDPQDPATSPAADGA